MIKAGEVQTATKVIGIFAQAGPWAVLALLLLGYLAYQLNKIVNTAGAAATAYIITSTESVKSLAASMEAMHLAHKTMLLGIGEIKDEVKQASDVRHTDVQRMDEALKKMGEAYEILSKIPTTDAEQLQLLRKIEEGIVELQSRGR